MTEVGYAVYLDDGPGSRKILSPSRDRLGKTQVPLSLWTTKRRRPVTKQGSKIVPCIKPKDGLRSKTKFVVPVSLFVCVQRT